MVKVERVGELAERHVLRTDLRRAAISLTIVLHGASPMNQRPYPIALLLAVWLGTTALDGQEPEGRQFGKAVLIQFDGVVSPRTEQYLYRKLDLGAERALISSSWRSTVPAVTWNPAWISRPACATWTGLTPLPGSPTKRSAARPSWPWGVTTSSCARARLGDAGPIFQGQDALFRHAPEKIRSDLARRVRDLAEAKGRPPVLAEAMVDMDLIVFRVTNKETGEVVFRSDNELVSDANPQMWVKGEPVLESQAGRFLEVNGQRAVELQLATATAENRDELVGLFGVQAPLVVIKPSGVDTAVYILNLPIITGLLFVVGLVALYVEFSAPGISIGGLLAGLCFSLFFWSRFLGGTAGWLEVILFLGGLVFLGIELFVLPGFGVAGITGMLMLLAGVVLASQNHFLPESPRALAQFGNSLIVVLASGGVFIAAVAALSRYFGSIPLFNRLILEAPPPADASEAAASKEGKPLPPSQDSSVVVGDWGVAESPLRPSGKAIFGGEYIDVVTDGSFVEKGSQVRVIEISGNRIVVREIENEA